MRAVAPQRFLSALGIFVWASPILAGLAPSHGYIQKQKVFGVNLYSQTFEPEAESALRARINELSREGAIAWDPDCRYRKFNRKCGTPSEFSAKIESITQLADDLKAETAGMYDAHTLYQSRSVRDFGGISQGFFLQDLKSNVKGEWYANFSGDTYLTQGHPLGEQGVYIAHPFFSKIPYAKVQMKLGGWLFVSLSNRSRIPGQNPALASKPDFERVVLFGHPEMHGGRLDGWATAIAAGGTKTLKHLWAIPKYQGKWAYLTLDAEMNASCSQNIQCRLGVEDDRLIEVKW